MKPKKIKEKRKKPETYRKVFDNHCYVKFEGDFFNKIKTEAEKEGFGFYELPSFIRHKLKKNLK